MLRQTLFISWSLIIADTSGGSHPIPGPHAMCELLSTGLCKLSHASQCLLVGTTHKIFFKVPQATPPTYHLRAFEAARVLYPVYLEVTLRRGRQKLGVSVLFSCFSEGSSWETFQVIFRCPDGTELLSIMAVTSTIELFTRFLSFSVSFAAFPHSCFLTSPSK